MILRRITRHQYHEFLDEFYGGKHPHLRLGQAFLNRFYEDTPCPELYYSNDEHHCVEYLEEHYVMPMEQAA